MEEKKLISHNNQVFENCEKDFQTFDGMAGNVDHKLNPYGRDLLLQLRLHPLSLQKPKNLPDTEVTKEKLYLHDITNTCSTSTDKQMNACNYPTSLKPEYYSIRSDYPLLPHYWNRLYPYCFSPHMFNGAYQNSSSKYRSSMHVYCNPLKKHSATNHCYKDFSMDECHWAKRYFATSEDMWNCYQSFNKKKEHLEAVPKQRKKLSIIDPVTGVNVLETVTSTHPLQQKDIIIENSELSVATGATVEKPTGDYFCSADVNDKPSLHLTNEAFSYSTPCSSEDKMNYDKLKCSDILFEAGPRNKNVDSDPIPKETLYDNKSASTATSNNENTSVDAKGGMALPATNSSVMQGISNETNISDNTCENYNTFKTADKKVNKATQYTESSHGGIRDSFLPECQKECNMRENVVKQKDSMKESFQQLRDKICSMRQEQRRMTILQSFLRYKMEESARNLDEKRIEITNWERNLLILAKRLYDKELWLESKSEILCNKAQQLVERKKMLNNEENNSSGDCLSSKSVLREMDFSSKEFAFERSTRSTWDEIPSKGKCSQSNDRSNDYTYFGYPTMNKVVEDSSSNVEKGKSDACPFDELEKDIAFIEKMHLSNEGGDGSLEDKTEMTSSTAMQKKDEDVPIGPSKGRHYMPEHIKYWLNKKEKSAL